MFADDEKPIRYHLLERFDDPGEPVFVDRIEPGTVDWVRRFEIPEDARIPERLDALLREVAKTQGGEAFRAMTERGECLRVFSVYDLADELSGKKSSLCTRPINIGSASRKDGLTFRPVTVVSAKNPRRSLGSMEGASQSR
jgi:hypothetical protein